MVHSSKIVMRLQSPWQPRLAPVEEGSSCNRLVSALSADILAGRIDVGARLPAHRDLAWRLGIGLGTVTKAYGVLERRGLVRSTKGSGTFVSATESRRGPLVDLSRNAPPAVMTERLLARSLAAVARRVDASLFNDYPPAAGHGQYRRELARWFRRLGMDADPARLLLTTGAQHALSIAFATACGSRGTLFVETQTYPGAIALARHLGIRLAMVAMDEEGLAPDALDRALARRRPGNAAVYVTPTMQNPTTSTMSRARRVAIAAICRARDVTIIEDDVYTLRADAMLPPLATLAPERTLYANSLSKTLNPSLRIGGLVAPDSLFDRAEAALLATGLTVSPLSCAVMEQWILDGTADAVSGAIEEEARRRNGVARASLADAMRHPTHNGYHVWIPLKRQDAERLDLAAQAMGILVTPPAATAAGPEAEGAGIRLCIGAPSSSELTSALGSIAGLLKGLQHTDATRRIRESAR